MDIDARIRAVFAKAEAKCIEEGKQLREKKLREEERLRVKEDMARSRARAVLMAYEGRYVDEVNEWLAGCQLDGSMEPKESTLKVYSAELADSASWRDAEITAFIDRVRAPLRGKEFMVELTLLPDSLIARDGVILHIEAAIKRIPPPREDDYGGPDCRNGGPELHSWSEAH